MDGLSAVFLCAQLCLYMFRYVKINQYSMSEEELEEELESIRQSCSHKSGDRGGSLWQHRRQQRGRRDIAGPGGRGCRRGIVGDGRYMQKLLDLRKKHCIYRGMRYNSGTAARSGRDMSRVKEERGRYVSKDRKEVYRG